MSVVKSEFVIARFGCLRTSRCYRLTKLPAFRRCLSLDSNQEHRKPLRILFCGSDSFSIKSLRAIHDYMLDASSNIASIDVAARTDKRTGRGLKTISAPPIKQAAIDLNLQLHQFDTFRGWNLPRSPDSNDAINLIIAVSFGLLVPPRILGGCEYGGLNVHPSLLPDLKGPAPIEHAIINDDVFTGVSIQTLHPTRFDDGKLLMQSPFPGVEIGYNVTLPVLRNQLAETGARMLVETLKKQLYVPSSELVPTTCSQPRTLRHAPKITAQNRHIKFGEMTARHIINIDRALSRTWTLARSSLHSDDTTRLIFQGIRTAIQTETRTLEELFGGGLPMGQPVLLPNLEKGPMFVQTVDHQVLAIEQVLVAGAALTDASSAVRKAKLVFNSGAGHIMFNAPLS